MKKNLIKYAIIILISVGAFVCGVFVAGNDITIISVLGYLLAILSIDGIVYVIKDIKKQKKIAAQNEPTIEQ